MIFFRPQWPGGPQEVNGVRLRPKREGSVFVLEAQAKHKQALVALGWKVRANPTSGRVPLSGPAATPKPAPAPEKPVDEPVDDTSVKDALSSNAKTVCKGVRSGDFDSILQEMLDVEEDAGVGAGSARTTVIEAINKRLAEID